MSVKTSAVQTLSPNPGLTKITCAIQLHCREVEQLLPTIITQKLEEAPSSQGISTGRILQNLTECKFSEQCDGKQPALTSPCLPCHSFLSECIL